jgi:site-specific DNA-cytosine methylase
MKQTLMFSLEEPRANPSASQDCEKDWTDPRGNLMLTFGAIAAKYRPKWMVWENVPGVFSSNGGKDFASFLGLITGQAVEPPAEGWSNSGVLSGHPSAYGVAWRVLDAQYFGVAQRRRRVFVVGHIGGLWHRAAAVLLERESLCWNSPPSRASGQDTAFDVAPCIGASGRGFERTGETRGQDPVIAIPIQQPDTSISGLDLDKKGCGIGDDGDPAFTIRSGQVDGVAVAVAFNIQDQNSGKSIKARPTEVAACLGTRDMSKYEGSFNCDVIAFAQNSRDEVREIGGKVSGALAAQPGMKQQTYVAIQEVAGTLRERKGGGSTTELDGHGAYIPELMSTLNANDGCKWGGNQWVDEGKAIITPALGIPGTWIGRKPENGGNATEPMNEVAPNLTAADRHGVVKGYAVRRLTPRECERLQGF